VNVAAVVGGAVAILLGAAILRYRAAVAGWQIATRIDERRRSSLLNTEYVEREVDALASPGSQRLSRWLVTLFAVALIGVGVVVVIKGLTAG